MNDKAKGAVETYQSGYNCAQGVLSEFAPQFGMDRDTAMRIACGLGSGMGRSGNMCGAVTGGILVLGLKYGMVDQELPEEKEKTYEEVVKFLDRVKELHGYTNCVDLMGVDVGTPEGRIEAQEKNLSDTICSKIVADVTGILEGLIEDGE